MVKSQYFSLELLFNLVIPLWVIKDLDIRADKTDLTQEVATREVTTMEAIVEGSKVEIKAPLNSIPLSTRLRCAATGSHRVLVNKVISAYLPTVITS